METLVTWLTGDFLGTAVWLWLVFATVVVALLAFDLGVLHRDDHAIEVKESLTLSATYVGIGLLFAGWVWWHLGVESSLNYLTGFLVEKTLAMDNVFVIAMIFAFFAIPREYQHRVLFWGILGVIVLRGIMIGLGAALVTEFQWILYIFGAFLVATGVKMLLFIKHELDLAGNPVLRFLLRHLRVTQQPHGRNFVVKLPAPEYRGGPPSTAPNAPLVWWATPLFMALVLIEIVDVIFAVDSVPAVFAITQDPFIVYTSNIFAILGLRALYFALAAMMHRFAYLKHALAFVLIFIGLKIFSVNLIGKLPAWFSLGVTLGLLAAGVVYSLYRTRGDGPTAAVSAHR